VGEVRCDIRDGVAWVAIDRPEAKNALSKAMYAEIRNICRRVWVDDSVFALVLTGKGGTFAVGGDLKEMLTALDGDDPAAILSYEEVLPFETLRALPKPTIGLVDGLCFGGGLTLLIMCDIAIATDSSEFAMPEAKVGIVDAYLPRLLRDAVPSSSLRYWLYTGARFSAAEAYAAGLLAKVVSADELVPTAEAVLDELRNSSPEAIGLYKQVLNETRPLAGMRDAYVTLLGADVRSRLRAFRKK
jgi:enoyl-CoA hydratase/carnithine racemase